MTAQRTNPATIVHRLTVSVDDAGLRIDQWLGRHVPEISRRRARKLIESGGVWVDRKRLTKLSRTVVAGASIEVHVPSELDPPVKEALPVERLVHEDGDLIVIDKASGTPSHATRARQWGSAVQLAEELLRLRHGHKIQLLGLARLDAATSGALLFAKNRPAAASVHAQLAARTVRKQYLAVVRGTPTPATGTIDVALHSESGRALADAVRGKPAETRYRLVATLEGGDSILEVEPITGRMHQIRVHLAAIGHPILGDDRYGTGVDAAAERLMLHARSVAIDHPTGGQRFRVDVGIPTDFPALETKEL